MLLRRSEVCLKTKPTNIQNLQDSKSYLYCQSWSLVPSRGQEAAHKGTIVWEAAVYNYAFMEDWLFSQFFNQVLSQRTTVKYPNCTFSFQVHPSLDSQHNTSFFTDTPCFVLLMRSPSLLPLHHPPCLELGCFFKLPDWFLLPFL